MTSEGEMLDEWRAVRSARAYMTPGSNQVLIVIYSEICSQNITVRMTYVKLGDGERTGLLLCLQIF